MERLDEGIRLGGPEFLIHGIFKEIAALEKKGAKALAKLSSPLI